MSGYTGVARKGHALRDPGHGRTDQERLTAPCPDCGRLARIERFDLNGQPVAQFVCSTWKNVRVGRVMRGVQGCKPRRLTQEEMEKFMAGLFADNGSAYLTDKQGEELKRLLEASGLSANRLSEECGWIRTRLSDIGRRKTKLTPDDWATIGSVTARFIQQREAEAKQILERKGPDQESTTEDRSDLELRVEALQLAVENLRNTFVEYRETVENRLGVDLIDRQTLAAILEENLTPMKVQQEAIDLLGSCVNDHQNALECLSERVESLESFGTVTGDFPQSGEVEFPPSWGNVVPSSKESTLDLLKGFANFERVCRNMRAKCPFLFEAAIQRSGQVFL